jgi:hypothetical protein
VFRSEEYFVKNNLNFFRISVAEVCKKYDRLCILIQLYLLAVGSVCGNRIVCRIRFMSICVWPHSVPLYVLFTCEMFHDAVNSETIQKETKFVHCPPLLVMIHCKKVENVRQHMSRDTQLLSCTSPSNGVNIPLSNVICHGDTFCVVRCTQDAQCRVGVRCHQMTIDYTHEEYCVMPCKSREPG